MPPRGSFSKGICRTAGHSGQRSTSLQMANMTSHSPAESWGSAHHPTAGDVVPTSYVSALAPSDLIYLMILLLVTSVPANAANPASAASAAA